MQALLRPCNCVERRACNCASLVTKDNIARSAMTVATVGSCLAQIKGNEPLIIAGGFLGIGGAVVSGIPKAMTAYSNVKKINSTRVRLETLHRIKNVAEADRLQDLQKMPKYPTTAQSLYLLPSLLQIGILIAINALSASSEIDISNANLKSPYPTIGLSVLGLILYFILEAWCNPEAQVEKAHDIYAQRRDRLIPDNLADRLENERRQIDEEVTRNTRLQMQDERDRPQPASPRNEVAPA